MDQPMQHPGSATPSTTVRPRIGVYQWFRILREFPVVPLCIVLIVVIVGIGGTAITPHDPMEQNLMRSLMPPFWEPGGSLEYPLGTDSLGRDLLSRVMLGARYALIVSLASVILSGTIGLTFAVLAGYFGGWIDTLIMRVTDAMMALPFLILAVALAGVMGPSLGNIILVLGLIGWTTQARVLRGEVLSLREREFIQLAKVASCSRFRIIMVHIIPNIANTWVVLATLQLGLVIIAESSLSFLGLGIPPPIPAWGSMLAEGRNYMMFAWWLAVFPGLAIMLAVLAANMVGDWLRVKLDPKQKRI